MNDGKNQNKTRFSYWRLKIIKYKYRNQNKNDPYIKTKGLLMPFYLFIYLLLLLLFYYFISANTLFEKHGATE